MFDNARWPNGPKICIATNLPAFETPEALESFRETNAPGGQIIARWQCTACGLWHYWGSGHDPAGGSSATTRTGKHIDELREKFLKSDVARTIPRT